VPPERVPADRDDQARLYRSLLAGRRMLIVLDNACDAGQVRPLLPGTPGCATLITSRTNLTGLVASHGASELTLNVLSEPDARVLLTRRLGAARLASEPDAAQDLIAVSGWLPLALAIIAELAVRRPTCSLRELAARHAYTRDRLDKLSTGELTTDLRAVFSWSYRSLSPAAARMFRLLGAHPGPDIGLAAATSLAGLLPDKTCDILAELTAAHLATEHRPGRFTLHDLLRVYAAELSRDGIADRESRPATRRSLDYYLRSAQAADRILNPERDQVTPPAPERSVIAEHFDDQSQATAWLDVELEVLLGAVSWAADAGFDVHAWQLPYMLVTYLDRRERLAEYEATQRAAVAAARRLGDVHAEAAAHREMAGAYGKMRRYDLARCSLTRSLRLFEALGDGGGQARTHLSLGWLLNLEHKYEQGLEHNQLALELFAAGGESIWQARALGTIGWSLTLLGSHEQALAICEHAIQLNRDLGDQFGEACTWDSLGETHHHLGQHHKAVECFQRAIAMFTRLDEPYYAAVALTHLGDTYQESRRTSAARAAWRKALAQFVDLDRPEANDLRAKLFKHDLVIFDSGRSC
jgi:tetratricopeptide (TPR) repeat protein